MEVIPSIDLLEGKVVRLEWGNRSRATTYSGNPAKTAREFLDNGAAMVHVVDLDAAFGSGNNLESIRGIAKVAKARFQVGGGVRTFEKARELLAHGACRVFVGTAAIDGPLLDSMASGFGKQLWIACDVRDGCVLTRGWTENTRISPEAFMMRLDGADIGGVLVTDISGDGMKAGANIPFFRRMRELTERPLLAAGGISSLPDIRALSAMGYEGVVLGKAVYENAFSLKDALEAAE